MTGAGAPTAADVRPAGSRTGDAIVAWNADSLLHLRFNRPERRNAASADMLLDLADALRGAGDDPAVRAVVLSGAGKTFCAGADLDTRDEPGADPSPATVDAANLVVRAIIGLPKVVVAAVRGPAVGVGVSIALAADLTLMHSDAYLLLAFTRVGLMPDGGSTALVAASAGRATALRLALLAQPLRATAAESLGLVAAVYDDGDFDEAVATTAASLAAGPGAAFALSKRSANDTALRDIGESLAFERAGQLELLASADFAEGVEAFGNKRAPRFGAGTPVPAGQEI